MLTGFNLKSYFGSNEIHVTPLQYSFTFLVFRVVFKIILDSILLYGVRYIQFLLM